MERELAMLAEEAEEDKRRREEEAADRILKRAQVVKHLRSLKSKLATAQIQIGQDLHYQSIDLFSQLYDEVLEDIGRDNNSEMLSLLKESVNDKTTADSDPEDSSMASHAGYMLTRSSDKPKRRDLISASTRPSNGAAVKHSTSDVRSTYHRSHRMENDSDSDSDHTSLRRQRRTKNRSQFIGQSWDVSSEGHASTLKSVTSNQKQAVIHLDDEDDDDDDDKDDDDSSNEDDNDAETPSPRKSLRSSDVQLHRISPTREELQLKHRQELEELQLRQRKDQEEFQRRQLEQLRDLQTKQNGEIERLDAAKARHYRERLEELAAAKRHRISQAHYGRGGDSSTPRSKRRTAYTSSSLAYEFDNGFQSHSPNDCTTQSPSPSPPKFQQQYSRSSTLVHHHLSSTTLGSNSDPGLSKRLLSPAVSSPSASRMHRTNGDINSLPMSTMTLALTAMNEKKRQQKLAMKQQLGQEDTSDRDSDQSDHRDQRHPTAGGSRFLSPPIWSQKRSAPEDSVDTKRSAHSPTTDSSSLLASSSDLTSLTHQQQQQQRHHHPHQHPNHHPNHNHNHNQHQRAGVLSASISKSNSATHLQSSPPPQTIREVSEGLLSPSKVKSRKRKNSSPVSSPSRLLHDSTSNKSAIGFNKTLLSHFDKWNPDERTEDFFDFVLSDPPDIDVDDTEVQGLLNGQRRLSEHGDRHEANATPTSNAFRWYQEQAKLAEELSRQPKMARLQLATDKEGDVQEHGHDDANGHQTQGEGGLIPGEDPLAAFIQQQQQQHQHQQQHQQQQQPRKKAGDVHKPESQQLDDESHSGFDAAGSQTGLQSDLAAETSPFLGSSPAMHLLYSEDGGDDWTFHPFSVDPTEEFLNHDSPLQDAHSEYQGQFH
ncbi:hypothetical protein BGZ98_004478 [Dissophora globulifera]|nr:hypothetical protein BGZ98_004478 [Dissophora globulifera]